MGVDNENRLGLAGQTSQEEALREKTKEWPANPQTTVQVSDENGGVRTIAFSEWLRMIGNNNRAGT
ncbi:MAG: hypothetical protein AAB875_03370 [Patescibacteria group bacterium]